MAQTGKPVTAMSHAIGMARASSTILVHATVPLLGHHTSGVRREFYRDDLEEAQGRDPIPKLYEKLTEGGMDEADINLLHAEIDASVQEAFDEARLSEEPVVDDLLPHRYAPAAILEERGIRHPESGEITLMVDCALHAMQEIMEDHPEALLYGQDVGARLGGVFREAATLGQKFGDHRVFNTPIQEAFIIGSTAGMSARVSAYRGSPVCGLPLARAQSIVHGTQPKLHAEQRAMADSRLIRVPIGAYGSGGPYHSSSIETVLANIRGIKVAYPSNGADLKGLLKSAFEDPNPVVVLEHKGLYWSKIPGTETAKVVEPIVIIAYPLAKQDWFNLSIRKRPHLRPAQRLSLSVVAFIGPRRLPKPSRDALKFSI